MIIKMKYSKLKSFGTNSLGNNHILINDVDKEIIILDLGVPVSKIEKFIKPYKLKGYQIITFISHNHIDHNRNLNNFSKKHSGIYVVPTPNHLQISYDTFKYKTNKTYYYQVFQHSNLDFSNYSTNNHFLIYDNLIYLTDIGDKLTEQIKEFIKQAYLHLKDVNNKILFILEANHCISKVKNSHLDSRNQRILDGKAHLSFKKAYNIGESTKRFLPNVEIYYTHISNDNKSEECKYYQKIKNRVLSNNDLQEWNK